MTSKSPIILILGSGPNVGQHVTQAFAARGYKVALISRKAKSEDDTPDQINIASDLADPNSVVEVFTKVKASLGIPSVVVYNAGAGYPYDEKDPLSLPLADFIRDLHINTTSAFVAAQQAALGFGQLSEPASKTFIYTGNILNTSTMAHLLDSGVGNSAMAHVIQSASQVYADRGFKFYYADERKADGSAAYFDISGEAHGEHYVKLAEGKSQGHWQQTFVKGIGYKQF